MSIEPSSSPTPVHDGRPEDPPDSVPDSKGGPAIREQAAEIIHGVLSGSEPEDESARTRLRRFLAAHPNRPEAALMDHLAALRSLPSSPAGVPVIRPRNDAASPQSSAGLFPHTAASVSSRIAAVLENRMMLTAFQAIRDLSTGGVVGAQAMTRFLGETGELAEDGFARVEDERLGCDLEFAEMESALTAARILPAHLFVTLKLSSYTCLDPLLAGFLEEYDVEPGRLVLEVSDTMTREEPTELAAALAPLRRTGIRLAIDHSGSNVTSIRHLRVLRPDIIKLDRNLVSGLDTNPFRSSLCEAMVGFAGHIGAGVIAQDIETAAELAAVRGLGIAAGQGSLLGAPTTHPEDWNVWPRTPGNWALQRRTRTDGHAR